MPPIVGDVMLSSGNPRASQLHGLPDDVRGWGLRKSTPVVTIARFTEKRLRRSCRRLLRR